MAKRFYIWLLITLLHCVAVVQGAVPPPSVRCASVAGNGDVTISWTKPADPTGTFQSYQIYAAANKTGPYLQIQTIANINQTSFTDVGANGQNKQKYYFIVSSSGPGGNDLSAPSDTVVNILLAVTKPVNNAIAHLAFYHPHSPPLSSAYPRFLIYKQIGAMPFSLIDSTSALQYADTNNTFCDSTLINYRVDIKDHAGCISLSSIGGKKFIDDQPPLFTDIEKVSVDTSVNKVTIYWHTNPSTDTKGYTVLETDAQGGYVEIDNVLVPSLSYTNPNSTAGSAPETYSISAFDGCGGTGNKGPYRTGHLSVCTKAQIDLCNGITKISWNPYIGWKNGVSGYELYVSTNGAPFVLLGSFPPNTNTYSHTGLVPNNDYRYLIKALEQNPVPSNQLFSLSNKTQRVSYIQPQVPNKMSISVASANIQNSYNSIQLAYDTNTTFKGFLVTRSVNMIEYDTIGFVQPRRFIYTDSSAINNQYSYYYQLVSVDECGNKRKISNQTRTILLQAIRGQNLSSLLTWNNYEDWMGDIQIYRIALPSSNAQLLKTVSYGTQSDSDNVAIERLSSGTFCYYLSSKNSTQPDVITFSNKVCLSQAPVMYIPSAFSPNGDGKNDTFGPINSFVSTTDYSFIVYNRWGYKVYETHNPQQQWDGNDLTGENCPTGVFAYYIQMHLDNGELFTKEGSVTLMR